MSELSEKWRDWNSTEMTPLTCADELDARDAEICRDIKSVLDSIPVRFAKRKCLRGILGKLGGQP